MNSERKHPRMTEEEYRTTILRYYTGPDKASSTLTLAALGLAGETGEVVDQIKKHLFQGHEIDRRQLRDELGDVLWYLMLLCQTMDYTLDEIMVANVEKLARRYPDGFDPERSRQRGFEDEEDENHG